MARSRSARCDGANIEIQQHVGGENMFIFGLLAEEVAARRRDGIDATATIEGSPALAEVLNAVDSGMFSPDDKSRYRGLVDALTASRLFHGHGRFRGLSDGAARGGRALAGPERVVAHRRAQHGAHELVFGRPRDPRLRAGDLARGTARCLPAGRSDGRSHAGSLPAATIDAIVEGRHADPFAVLGIHEADGGIVVRAFVPGAD